MIINDRHSQRNRLLRRRTWVLAAGLFLTLGLAAVLWPATEPAEPAVLAFCDAETVRNGRFVHNGQDFGDGDLQSDQRAYSGRYACRLLPGASARFGFTYQLTDARPGEFYRASVWRHAPISTEGALVATGRGGGAFYQRQNRPEETTPDGWARLELLFQIPRDGSFSSFEVHVFSSGVDTVYFDDLQIERLDQWTGKGFDPARLELTVQPQAMQILEAKRAEALAAGILQTSGDDWVEGQLREEGGKPLAVRLRLKGDWLDHLHGDKWSFRIQVRDGGSWRRMVTFSLHTPLARYFLHEWLLHQFWEREDVLTTRYDFVELTLNGRPLGIYAYEEHFEKQLVESRRRREGPILKFSEDGFWLGIERQLQHHGFVRTESGHSAMAAETAPIQAFDEKKTAASPDLAAQFERAQSLLEQYRAGTRPAAEIFDLTRLARYFAICDLLNGYHGIVWHNQRFYFNQITDRIEPVGFDGFGGPPAEQYTILGQGALNPGSLLSQGLFSRLFLDPEFAAAYIRALYRLSSDDYFDNFLADMEAGWTTRLTYLQSEFPEYRPEWENFRTQAQFVHSLLLPYPDQSLRTYTLDYAGSAKRLRVSNTHNLPVEVIGYGLNAGGPVIPLDSALLLPGHLPRRFLVRLLRDSVGRLRDFDQIRFLEQQALTAQQTRVFHELPVSRSATHLFFRTLGTDSLFSARISSWTPPRTELPDRGLFHSTEPVSNDLYEVAGRTIRFRQGPLATDRDIIIPAGYEVFFNEGTTLDLYDGARFLTRSPLRMNGSEEAPILITSRDGSAGGFTVLQTGSLSTLDHVVFENLNTLRSGGWMLTGMVTFYESDVRFYRCAFLKSNCEDALNTVRSEILVDQCRFGYTFSDGFDSDFCKGEIRNSFFYHTGNDGLDFSGSIINVYDCRFENNGDKGISVGEESDVAVFRTSISGAPIAVASKDLSVLYARDLTISNCDQGFVAFQKKPEFGPARIVVESYMAEGIRRLHNIAAGSRLQLEGRMVE